MGESCGSNGVMMKCCKRSRTLDVNNLDGHISLVAAIWWKMPKTTSRVTPLTFGTKVEKEVQKSDGLLPGTLSGAIPKIWWTVPNTEPLSPISTFLEICWQARIVKAIRNLLFVEVNHKPQQESASGRDCVLVVAVSERDRVPLWRRGSDRSVCLATVHLAFNSVILFRLSSCLVSARHVHVLLCVSHLHMLNICRHYNAQCVKAANSMALFTGPFYSARS